jgi:Holliday junction resolvase RusA-like endonuclease
VKQATLDVLTVGPVDEHGMAERIGFPFDRDPLSVAVRFRLPRPAGHYRTGANAHLLRETAPAWPSGRPDVDKLLRSTLDALGEAGLWRDDCQVVQAVAVKVWCDRLEPAGANIEVTAL